MPRPYALIRAGFPYVKTIGTFITCSSPHDVAFGQEGRIYVLCAGNAGPISILNFEDDDLGAFGAPDFGFRHPSHKCSPGNTDWPVRDGALLAPSQIIVDSDELIYVSDEATHRISIWNRHGEFLGKWGEYGSDMGQMDRPAGIAFDSEENMFVADAMNHRIQKFTSTGDFLMTFGGHGIGEGEFDYPWGLHVDELDDIYVVDWRNDRVQKFNRDGEFIFALGSSGGGDGQFNRPSGVAVDKDGDIYVADRGNNRVQLFTSEGQYVQKFLGEATLSKSTLARMLTRNGRFNRIALMACQEPQKFHRHPRSVRIDDQGYMFVPDYEDQRIQIYKKESYPLLEENVAPPLKAETLTAS